MSLSRHLCVQYRCGPNCGPNKSGTHFLESECGPKLVMPTVTTRNLMSVPDGRHPICEGLHLRVRGKYRYFIFRYQLNGKRRDLQLGTASTMTLQEARDEALKCRLLVAKGVDPLLVREVDESVRKGKVNNGKTFGEFYPAAMADFLQIRQVTPRTEANYRSVASNYLLPVLGPLPLTEITTQIVVDILRPIWTKKTPTAINVRFVLEHLLDIAIRDGLIAKNPATWRGNLAAYLPSSVKVHDVEHRVAPSLEELKKGMEWLLSSWGVSSKAAVFVALCACRLSESLAGKWSEIDGAVFSVPPERRKDRQRVPFRIPLSKQALFILSQKDSKESPLIFESRLKPGVPCTKAAVLMSLRTALNRPNITVHGLRSTFRDWCAENGVDFFLAEACLCHKMGGDTQVAYLRTDLLDKRREVMQRWADEILPMEKLKEMSINWK